MLGRYIEIQSSDAKEDVFLKVLKRAIHVAVETKLNDLKLEELSEQYQTLKNDFHSAASSNSQVFGFDDDILAPSVEEEKKFDHLLINLVKTLVLCLNKMSELEIETKESQCFSELNVLVPYLLDEFKKFLYNMNNFKPSYLPMLWSEKKESLKNVSTQPNRHNLNARSHSMNGMNHHRATNQTTRILESKETAITDVNELVDLITKKMRGYFESVINNQKQSSSRLFPSANGVESSINEFRDSLIKHILEEKEKVIQEINSRESELLKNDMRGFLKVFFSTLETFVSDQLSTNDNDSGWFGLLCIKLMGIKKDLHEVVEQIDKMDLTDLKKRYAGATQIARPASQI